MSQLMVRGLLGASVTAVVLSASGISTAAFEFLVTAAGTKQGKFVDDSSQGTVGLAYYHEATGAAIDPQTGQASGKSQSGPVTVTKAWGPSSPQYYVALASNELLKTVTFNFDYRATGGAYEMVQLTNVTVSSIRRRVDPVSGPVEDISFVCQHLDITEVVGGVTATLP